MIQLLRRRPKPNGLELLVLQPTPLCNLDCGYCYLPNRRSRAKMTSEVLEAAAQRVAESPFLRAELTVVWHAGEPLVLAPAWYEDAFERLEQKLGSRTHLTHAFQTNGTRIDERWLPLLQRSDVRIGVSYDGPAFLHDRNRKRLDGAGSHAAVRRGMALLQSVGIPFHCIAVVTAETLQYPDAFFQDMCSTGAYEVGLNFEEREGLNSTSSLDSAHLADVRSFFARLLHLPRATPGAPRLREADTLSALLMLPRPPRGGTQENESFRILSVGHDGSFSTWSPELLEHRDPAGTGYILGNVLTTSLAEAARSEHFRTLERAIVRGRERCAATCAHYAICGGGSPSNKASELGRLDGTETAHCRVARKALAEVVLAALERDLSA